MIYSSFDPDIGRYRYYDAADYTPPPIPRTHPFLGTAADDAMPTLPLLAREIGTGEEAIGRVVKPGIRWQQLFKWGVYALAIYGALRWLGG